MMIARSGHPTFSVEFFPAKTAQAQEALWEAMDAYAQAGPAYMTVTYGAGGSTKEGTLATLQTAVKTYPQVPFASHLTFLSTTRADLDVYLASLRDAGVRMIVALRGDLPAGARYEDFVGSDYFQWTSDFVAYIKAHYNFQVIVGAYPEKHPDAPDLAADIVALTKKCAAGADSATTQFFFDNEVFWRFADLCREAGIATPIHPGLLPIHDFANVQRFATKCGAGIPEQIAQIFANLPAADSDAAVRAASAILETQVRDLLARGQKHIHFYAMNKTGITLPVIQNILKF
jgi:methylenetetrahydrofolate reductase (NADPH)